MEDCANYTNLFIFVAIKHIMVDVLVFIYVIILCSMSGNTIILHDFI